jgi:hypothetical protein
LVGEIGAGDPPPLAVRKPPEVVEDTEIAGGVGTGSAEEPAIARAIGLGLASTLPARVLAGATPRGFRRCRVGWPRCWQDSSRSSTSTDRRVSPKVAEVAEAAEAAEVVEVVEVAAVAGGVFSKAAGGPEVALHVDPAYAWYRAPERCWRPDRRESTPNTAHPIAARDEEPGAEM